MVDAVLKLSGIVKSYGSGETALAVLDGAELAIAPGEVVALVGASGSGKTTLLQITGGLDLPDVGEVSWLGQRIDTLDDATRTRLRSQQLGFVFQFHHLLPEFTALENVMLPQLLAGTGQVDAKLRAESLLERLHVADRGHHLPSQLSGGQQQRVAIARALANRPAMLLADEPTGNLDPHTSDDVFALLLELAREEGLAALIATHNHALAQRLHRVVAMRDGRVVQFTS
jgi:lipoprotein-releasing system ATP-binding protein